MTPRTRWQAQELLRGYDSSGRQTAVFGTRIEMNNDRVMPYYRSDHRGGFTLSLRKDHRPHRLGWDLRQEVTLGKDSGGKMLGGSGIRMIFLSSISKAHGIRDCRLVSLSLYGCYFMRMPWP